MAYVLMYLGNFIGGIWVPMGHNTLGGCYMNKTDLLVPAQWGTLLTALIPNNMSVVSGFR